jgi:hypothetical protein
MLPTGDHLQGSQGQKFRKRMQNQSLPYEFIRLLSEDKYSVINAQTSFTRRRAHAGGFLRWAVPLSAALFLSMPSMSATFSFSTGNTDGRMATGSRPGGNGLLEIESADDFFLTEGTRINQATFTGLLPAGVSLGSVNQVAVEIYRVFPLDSTDPPDGRVPTRNNSPSDNALDSRDSVAATLKFTAGVINPSFTAANSVLNGIHPKPNQNTLGEGPVTGQEVQFSVTFTTPFELAPGHYFFVPQVGLNQGDFLWLSAPKPIVSPGTPFNQDLQSWIRNGDLDPDWLRIGTDIVGGTTPPTFNSVFSLVGSVPEISSTAGLLAFAFMCVVVCSRRWRRLQ